MDGAPSADAPPPVPPAPRVCAMPGCVKPVFVETVNGTPYPFDYCGRTHAAAHRGAQNISAPHGVAYKCKLAGCYNTRFFDRANGRVEDYCSRTHARAAGAFPRARGPPASPPPATTSPAERCSYPGCAARKWPGKDFCGLTHATRARLDGVLPAAAAGLDELPASAYMVRGVPDAFTVTLLTRAKPNYKHVKQALLQNWSGAKPQIRHVFELRNAAQLERYARHKAELRAGAEGAAPREQRRFLRARHAPTCSFGIDTRPNTCGRADCAVCATCAHGVADAARLCKRSSRAHELPLEFDSGAAAGDAAAVVFLCNTVASRAGDAVAEDEVTDGRVLAIPKYLFVYTPPRRDDTAAGVTQGEEARAELAPEHAADASAEDWSWQSEITARGGTSSAIDEPH